jgi:hypothetical protein
MLKETFEQFGIEASLMSFVRDSLETLQIV